MPGHYEWNQTYGDLFGSNTDSPTNILPVTYKMAELQAPFLTSDVLIATRIGCSVSLVASHNTSAPLVGWQAGGWAMFGAECYSADSSVWPDPSNPGVNRMQSTDWLPPTFSINGVSNELGGFTCSTVGMVESRGRRNLGDIGGALPALRVSLSYGWPFFVENPPDQWTWTISWYVRALWLTQA